MRILSKTQAITVFKNQASREALNRQSFLIHSPAIKQRFKIVTMAVFNQISLNHSQLTLFLKIRHRGRKEQEKQFLFPGLYTSKAVTRQTIGEYKHFERQLKQGKHER